MNKKLKIALMTPALIISAFAFANAANSGKLPKDAKPLTAEEAQGVFAGKTINWQPAKAYWRPDGSAIGYYPVKGDEGFAEGTWKVSGNQICIYLEWRGKDKAKAPYIEDTCAKYYTSKGKIWVENVKDDPKWQGDIWSGIEKKLKKGDSVSKKAAALKKSFGY